MTKPTNGSVWAFALSDQSLRCPHEETLCPQLPTERIAKTDHTGRMRADLSLPWAHRPFCWFCHAVAQMHDAILIYTRGASCFFKQ